MTLAIIMSHQWNDTCATKAKVCSVLAKVIKSTAVPQQKAQKGELRKPATPAQMESSSFSHDFGPYQSEEGREKGRREKWHTIMYIAEDAEKAQIYYYKAVSCSITQVAEESAPLSTSL